MTAEPEMNEIDALVSVRVDQIELGERLRPVDADWARALGQIMARQGQQTPVEICRLPGQSNWTIVTGAHRLVGARSAGIAYLKAIVVGADRAERRMREVSENLWRRDLEPIDRAAFIAELALLYRQRAGIAKADHRSKSVPSKWKQALQAEAVETLETISNVYGWSEEIGAQLGLTSRTVRNDLLIYRRIAPSLIDQLRRERHPVATNATQLRALAKLEPEQQREVVEYLVWRTHPSGVGPVKSVAAAIALTRDNLSAADPETKRLTTFLGTFGRMSLAEKKGALAQLAGMLPAGFSIEGVTE
jgi:hypothetical protein